MVGAHAARTPFANERLRFTCSSSLRSVSIFPLSVVPPVHPGGIWGGGWSEAFVCVLSKWEWGVSGAVV